MSLSMTLEQPYLFVLYKFREFAYVTSIMVYAAAEIIGKNGVMLRAVGGESEEGWKEREWE